jgi:hypothetical protein
MPNDTQGRPDAGNEPTMREDEPIPSASDEKVIEETARLAREGRKEREADPAERDRKDD